MTNKEYILNKILTSEVSSEPWKHMIIKDFLPEDLYLGIKQEISPYLKRKEIDNKWMRSFANLYNKSVNFQPDKNTHPHLYEYFKILSDIEIENAIKQRVNLNDYHTNELSIDMWSALDINKSGLVYDVHQDHGSKMHTLVHYLADEGDDETLGTSLYTANEDYTELDTTKDFVKCAPYLPNTVIIFSPCTKKGFMTNHAMFNLSKTTIYRKTIQTFWLNKKENWLDKLKTAIKLN